MKPTIALPIGALALTAGAVWNAYEHDWYPAVTLGWIAFLLLVLAAGARHHDQTVRTRHDQARRAARLDDETLAVCCQIGRHSEGQAHGPDCTRPPLPRRDKGSAA